jgi:argininosuccinate lyase
MPFREAHKVVGQLVQTAHASGKSLSQMSLGDIKKSKTEVDAKKMLKIISSITVETSLKNRTSRGSSGILEQKRMVADRRAKAQTYRTGTTKRAAEVAASIKSLSAKIASL